jgi:hypothetical protein
LFLLLAVGVPTKAFVAGSARAATTAQKIATILAVQRPVIAVMVSESFSLSVDCLARLWSNDRIANTVVGDVASLAVANERFAPTIAARGFRVL